MASTLLGQSSNSDTYENIRVDELTDNQIRQMLRQVEATGMTEGQLEQVALSRGMQPEEVQKLKMRVAAIQVKDGTQQKARSEPENDIPNADENSRKYVPDSLDQASINQAFDALRPKVFGEELFRNSKLTFEPNLRIATPTNYVIGPDDQLNISVYGNSVVDWKLNVSPEGNIQIPGVGFLNVSGKTIEQATILIKNKLAANRYAIGRGTNVEVSLGNIRSIKVIMVGELVKPGTYSLPSLATVFNALYASGGPNQNGSFRQIEVIRNNKVIRKLDVYDFLLRGDQQNNVRLQDQDIIRVPTYKLRVEIAGEIKRPALYEILPGETLQNALAFAGGFTDMAYTSRIKVFQVTGKERKITDVAETDFTNYVPLRGDKYMIEEILERFENRVTIAGAVFRPGQYELDNGLTLSQLIAKAEGLKEDAFGSRGYITRLKADNTSELIPFDIKGIIAHQLPDIVLQREDQVSIPSLFDLRDSLTISIKGEVRKPGEFSFSEKMTVEDLLVKAGGFSEGASNQRIEVSRRVKNSDPKSTTSVVAEVFHLNVDKDLKVRDARFALMPFDMISVYSLPGFERQKTVRIEGEVLYPGYYTIQKKNEKISDLVNRAGGITASADIEGASLKRLLIQPADTAKNEIDKKDLEKERLAKVQRLGGMVKDSIDEAELLQNPYVGINLKNIMEKPKAGNDLLLEDGDVLRIPKQQQVVRVSGEILFPSSVIYAKSKGLKSYVKNAGGFSGDAYKGRAYVVYPNGTVKSTGKILFWNNYPNVKPGSEIIIPERPERRKITSQELLGITTGVASLGAIILGIINLSK